MKLSYVLRKAAQKAELCTKSAFIADNYNLDYPETQIILLDDLLGCPSAAYKVTIEKIKKKT